MPEQETLHTLALTQLRNIPPAALLELYQRAGSATAIVDHRHHLRDLLPDISQRLVDALTNDLETSMERAEKELLYCQQYNIRVLCLNDEDYPRRLAECPDAPLALFYRGTASLNTRRVINIIGTRHCTTYGQDLIRRFVADLRQYVPDTLIVSGLAYGIDVCAHRQALANGFETVGVLAHGLDMIYPNAHRQTAVDMLSHGGLLTEFMTQTRPIPQNFIQRNRIVAGMSDACILVESAAKGGGLITAGISRSYNRDVFAFPGAVGAPYSEGCNRLIRDSGAALITSADDFVAAMGWDGDVRLTEAREKGIERELFPNLTTEEQAIVDVLLKNNDLQANTLSVQSGVPIGQLTALLFELELKGVVKLLAGGACHLMR